MGFDLASAQPVSQGFDLSTAQPVAGSPPPSTSYNPAGPGYTNTLQVANPFGDNLDTGIPMGTGMQNYLAGRGKATYDLVRGLGQDLGLVSRQDVANSRALDAPLMATGAGKAGYVEGTMTNLLPAAFIPGANTLAGAGAIGATMGLLQPSTSTGETMFNAGLGGLMAPAGILAGRAAGALYQGGKAVLEPLFQGGQQRVAARALQAFAGGPQAAADAANTIQSAGNFLPGVEPTTAELANNAGLAQMERSLRNNPEYLSALTARNQANRGAMTSALEGIAGNDSDMALEQQIRTSATAPLYANARSATAASDPELTSILSRPSMQSAWQRAQQLASERGDSLLSGQDIPEHVVNSSVLDGSGQPFSQTVPAQTSQYSGKALQYLKMSLNDSVNQAEQRGMGAHELGAMKQTLGSLNDWISSNVPALSAADRSFELLSGNINQMQVGQALSNKLLPSLADFGNNTRLNANSYAGAVRNGDALASNVTGQQNATLSGVLSADQLRTVMQVGDQLARRSNADELGRAVGSNTGQNLISQNVLRQFLGPLGLPQSMTERASQSALGQSVLRPVQWATKVGEPRVMDVLAQSSLSPQFAARLLQAGVDPGMAHMVWARQGLLGSLASSAAYTTQK